MPFMQAFKLKRYLFVERSPAAISDAVAHMTFLTICTRICCRYKVLSAIGFYFDSLYIL